MTNQDAATRIRRMAKRAHNNSKALWSIIFKKVVDAMGLTRDREVLTRRVKVIITLFTREENYGSGRTFVDHAVRQSNIAKACEELRERITPCALDVLPEVPLYERNPIIIDVIRGVELALFQPFGEAKADEEVFDAEEEGKEEEDSDSGSDSDDMPMPPPVPVAEESTVVVPVPQVAVPEQDQSIDHQAAIMERNSVPLEMPSVSIYIQQRAEVEADPMDDASSLMGKKDSFVSDEDEAQVESFFVKDDKPIAKEEEEKAKAPQPEEIEVRQDSPKKKKTKKVVEAAPLLQRTSHRARKAPGRFSPT